MAKRKSNRRRRAAGQQRRSRDSAAGVRRVALDDLLLRPTASGEVAPAPDTPVLIGSEDRRGPQIQSEAVLEPVPDAGPAGPVIRLGVVWAFITFVILGIGVIA